jgi:ribosome-associated protein
LIDMIRINDRLSIDEKEIHFSYARSPGPGGQRVNKVATKVTLHFDVPSCPALSDAQKERLRAALAGRTNKEGVLRITRSRHRTQPANRRDALEAFASLIAKSLRPQRPRKKTQPGRAARERRLAEKARRSRQKQERAFRYGGGED